MVARVLEQQKGHHSSLGFRYLNEKYAEMVTDDLLGTATLAIQNPKFMAQYIKPDKVEAIKSRALCEKWLMTKGNPRQGL